MQQVGRLWRLAGAASSARETARETMRDLTQQVKVHHFAVQKEITFYLRTEAARVQVLRWGRPFIELTTTLQSAFGWRVLMDQDDAGVYVAAKRRFMIDALPSVLTSAEFVVYLPYSTHGILQVEACDVHLTNTSGTFELAGAGLVQGDPINLLEDGKP